MAYVTGSANSMGDLLSAVQNACTANGWTLSGTVLHKGTCYADLSINSYLRLTAGTGVDANDALTGASDMNEGILGYSMAGPAFGWPVTYHIHIFDAPDEVLVVCHYAVNFYQILGFGQSDMPGLTGTGNWYAGCYAGLDSRFRPPNGVNKDDGASTFAHIARSGLFMEWLNANPEYRSSGVDHGLAATWETEGSARDWASIYFRQPNQWNNESILIPIRVYAQRPSGFVSPVLEVHNARHVSIANLQDGQIIQLGGDQWKIYPYYHRGTSASAHNSSGWAGHAIRYDGP